MNMRKILLGGLLATAAIGGIAACWSGANSSDHQTAGTHAPVVPPSAAQPAKPVPPSAAQPAKPTPQYTPAQEKAIGSANDYLDMSGFSRAGLIKQLSSSFGDGYSEADATFAVDHLTVDWNQQAVRSAKDYLSMTHFSRAGLIEQLSSPYGSGYTVAQTGYAANHVGLWPAQHHRSAGTVDGVTKDQPDHPGGLIRLEPPTPLRGGGFAVPEVCQFALAFMQVLPDPPEDVPRRSRLLAYTRKLLDEP